MAKKNIPLSIDEELLIRLNEYCKLTGVTRSRLICIGAEKELEERLKKEDKEEKN